MVWTPAGSAIAQNVIPEYPPRSTVLAVWSRNNGQPSMSSTTPPSGVRVSDTPASLPSTLLMSNPISAPQLAGPVSGGGGSGSARLFC